MSRSYAFGVAAAVALLASGGALAQEQGPAIYQQHCAVCHGQQGEGLTGPNLAGNDNLAQTDRMIRQVLNGGQQMPPFASVLNDEQVAAVLTHERNSWGNEFGPVSAEEVAAQRSGRPGAAQGGEEPPPEEPPAEEPAEPPAEQPAEPPEEQPQEPAEPAPAPPEEPEAPPAGQQGGVAGHASADPSAVPRSFQGEYNPVTDERLLQPEDRNWLMYKRTYDLQGYSPLDQVNAENVADLEPVWTFATGVTDGHEAPPIVNDGIMFVTGAFNTLFALDARNGDLIWEYRRELAPDVAPEVCCGMVNRGVALYGDKLYMATLDSHLLAFDAVSGEIVWDTTVADYKQGYAMTVAPLAAEGKVLVGVAGGEYGIRGFVAAYDTETGEEVWRTYMIPEPGEPGSDTWPGDTWRTGGAPIWVTGSYDPELGLTYWGTGNGGPWMGDARPGDNLYVASVVAMDMDTGEIVSHYQYVPNESWDYDEISDQTLVTVERDGQTIQGLIHAGRNGYFYLLDRTNLDFVYAVPYIEGEPKTITGFDEDGRPIIPEERKPGLDKPAEACPVTGGANNWFGLSFSPQTGYAYVPTTEYCMTITGVAVEYQAGQNFTGAEAQRYPPEGMDWTGALQAIDVATGEVVWKREQTMPSRSPVTATAGGLVFGGDIFDREFRAYDASNGEILWRFKTNSSVVGVPVTYEIDGVQYVAVQAGYGGAAANYIPRAAEAFGIPFTPVRGGTVWVFALDQQQQP